MDKLNFITNLEQLTAIINFILIIPIIAIIKTFIDRDSLDDVMLSRPKQRIKKIIKVIGIILFILIFNTIFILQFYILTVLPLKYADNSFVIDIIYIISTICSNLIGYYYLILIFSSIFKYKKLKFLTILYIILTTLAVLKLNIIYGSVYLIIVAILMYFIKRCLFS